MKNKSLEGIFKAILEVGFAKKSKKKQTQAMIPWEEQFDLEAWGGWDFEMKIHKTEIIGNGKTQEVTVKGIFKQPYELGFSTLTVVIIVFNRNMPVENTDDISPLKEFGGCFWEPTEIKYCTSPFTLNKVISLDPVKSMR